MPVSTENGVRKSNELPAEDAALDLEALDERAEHHALREGRDHRAVAEAMIPEGPVLGVRKRNSKATPRKTSASSMTRIGK